MRLEQYLALIIKQWWIIVICFVTVGVGAYIGSKLMTPIYQSTTLVQVVIQSGTSQAAIDNLLASDQLVQTEALLATSDPVLREVASHYSGLTVEQLSREVSSTTETSTQIFKIDVNDPSPTRAAALANDIAETLIKQQLQAAQQDNTRSQQQIQQDLTATRLQINTITNQLVALQAQGKSGVQVVALQGQLNGLQQHYNQWQAILAQLELTEAQNENFLHIAQPAQPGLRPVQPNVLLNTIAGLLAGLFLGMLLAIMFDRLDMRVRTSEALSQLLDWSILATVWQAGRKENVINPTGRDANVEAYRILRTNIGFAAVDKPLQTLVVTSALPRDGKSIVAANLAIFMARAGKNTLLIDADLRRPMQHENFGIPADKMGLSNAILAFSTPATAKAASYDHSPAATPELFSSTASTPRPFLDPFVCAVGIPNLCVMPSGPLPPNPPELLDSKAMQRFLETLATSEVEVVILDTPPLLGLSDASVLSSKADGTIFVVDITRADKRNLKQIKVLLEKAGTHILGCVVNKQRRGRDDSVYSSYYYRTDEKKGRRSHGKKDANSAAISPGVLKQSKTQSQLDSVDRAEKLVPVHPIKAETQTQASLFDRDTIKTTSVYSVESETQSRTGLSDGRKGE
jgi:Mrp family chromosome partitioning ATPase/capsular polysaccharide biosynthesis protein